jgi:hypothetical protein
MTRFHPDIIDDQKLDEDAKERAKLRKHGAWGVAPENKATHAMRVSATRRKKVPVTLPTVKFLKD